MSDAHPGPPAYSADLQVLLACARLRMGPADREAAHMAVRRGADWASIIDLADAHGLLPLLHEHATRGDVAPPGTARERLAARALASARHSLALGAELVAVIKACAASGIQVLPLKGPLLAQQVYGSIAGRQPRDLDVLVRRRDLIAAIDLLRDRGYRLSAEVPPEFHGMLRLNSHHIPAVVSKAATIEIHHCLSTHARDQLALDAIAGRLATTTLLGTSVLTLTPEDQFVYLCEHGSYHAWSRLEWLVTVRELACKPMDWRKVAAWATEWGGMTRIETGIFLATTLLGEIDGGGQRPPSAPARAAAMRAVHHLQRDPLSVRSSPQVRLRFQLATDASWRARVARCCRMLRPSHEDLSFVHLPSGLRALYYGVRPIRILTTAARRRRAA